MADIALSDYISQKKIGQRLGARPTTMAPAPRSQVYNRLSSGKAVLSTTMKAKPLVAAGSDARNKIIQLKRKNLTDARDHLGELAKKIDARTRITNKSSAPSAQMNNGLLPKPNEPVDMREKLNRKNRQAVPNQQRNNVQQYLNNQQPSRGGAQPMQNSTTTIVRTINTGRPAQPTRPMQNTRPVQQSRPAPQPYVEPTRTVRQPARSAQPARSVQPVRSAQPVRNVQSAPVVRKVIKQVPQQIRTVTVPRTQTIRAAAVPAVRKVYRQPVQRQVVYEDDPYDVEYVEEPEVEDPYVEVVEEPMYEEPMYDEVYEEPEPVYRPRKVIVKKPYVRPAPRTVSYQRPVRQAQPQPLMQQSRPEPFVQQQQPNSYMPQQQQPFFPQQQQQSGQFYGNQQPQPLMNNMQYGAAMPPMQQQQQFPMQQQQYPMQQQQQYNNRPMQQYNEPQQHNEPQQQYNKPQQQYNKPQQHYNKPQQQYKSQQQHKPQQQYNKPQQQYNRQRSPVRSSQPARTVQQRTSGRAAPEPASRLAPARAPVTAPRRAAPAPKAAPKVIGQRVSVSNLHPVATADDIEELFENIGQVVSAKMVTSGTVVVVFREMADARKAVEIYHNRKLDGQPMQVKILGSVYESK